MSARTSVRSVAAVRCPDGRRLVLSGRPSRPGGPRPDLLRATASRRPTSPSGGSAMRRPPCASRTGRSSRWAACSAAHPATRASPTSPSPAITQTALLTRASQATASRRPISPGGTMRQPESHSRATAKSSWSAGPASAVRSGTASTLLSPATTRTVPSTRASRATASRRRALVSPMWRRGWPFRPTARSSQSATTATVIPTPPATSRSPDSTPTDRWTRASPATESRPPTSGTSISRTQRGSRETARSSRSAMSVKYQRAPDFALARFNSNGSLDTSFSGDGKQTTDFGSSGDRAHGVAIQADGKIVAAGEAWAAPASTSRSPATTPTARSTRASPATAS